MEDRIYVCKKCDVSVRESQRQHHSWDRHRTKDLRNSYSLIELETFSGKIVCQRKNNVVNKNGESNVVENVPYAIAQQNTTWEQFKASMSHLGEFFMWILNFFLYILNFLLRASMLFIRLIPSFCMVLTVLSFAYALWTYWENLYIFFEILMGFLKFTYNRVMFLLKTATQAVYNTKKGEMGDNIAKGTGAEFLTKHITQMLESLKKTLELMTIFANDLLGPEQVKGVVEAWIKATKIPTHEFSDSRVMWEVTKKFDEKVLKCIAKITEIKNETKEDWSNTLKGCRLLQFE